MSDRESANITKEKMTVLYVKPGEKPKRIEIENDGYLEKMVVFDLSSRFKSKSTLFLLVVFCSITGILY